MCEHPIKILKYHSKVKKKVSTHIAAAFGEKLKDS